MLVNACCNYTNKDFVFESFESDPSFLLLGHEVGENSLFLTYADMTLLCRAQLETVHDPLKPFWAYAFCMGMLVPKWV